jgi:hypothetical protein
MGTKFLHYLYNEILSSQGGFGGGYEIKFYGGIVRRIL